MADQDATGSGPSLHADCLTCQAHRGERPAPGGVIYQDALWRLEHAWQPIPLAGWLVLKPLRHVEAFADLTPEEAAWFGPLVQRMTRAMTAVLAPAKIYICLYAEAVNVAHVHFHLIPRAPGLPPELRGPGIFDLLRQAVREGRNLADAAAAERIVAAIRQQMLADA